MAWEDRWCEPDEEQESEMLAQSPTFTSTANTTQASKLWQSWKCASLEQVCYKCSHFLLVFYVVWNKVNLCNLSRVLGILAPGLSEAWLSSPGCKVRRFLMRSSDLLTHFLTQEIELTPPSWPLGSKSRILSWWDAAKPPKKRKTHFSLSALCLYAKGLVATWTLT